MQVEITGAGFHGGIDKTDARVFWVEAQTEAQVQDAVAGTDAHYGPLPGNEDGVSVYAPATAIDYRLPADHDALRAKLLEWQAATPTAEQLLAALQDLNACNWLDADPSDTDELGAAKATARALLPTR